MTLKTSKTTLQDYITHPTNTEHAILVAQDAKAYILEPPSTGGTWTLGRSRETDVPIPHPSVSRWHAHISRKDGHYVIYDRGSKNGVKLNGRKITPRKTYLLGEHATILLGETCLRFYTSHSTYIKHS